MDDPPIVVHHVKPDFVRRAADAHDRAASLAAEQRHPVNDERRAPQLGFGRRVLHGDEETGGQPRLEHRALHRPRFGVPVLRERGIAAMIGSVPQFGFCGHFDQLRHFGLLARCSHSSGAPRPLSRHRTMSARLSNTGRPSCLANATSRSAPTDSPGIR